MNKEAKIGLTIILTLIITFVAVLAKRLYSSYAARQSIAAEDDSVNIFRQSADTEKNPSNTPDKTKTPIALAGQPTLVAPASGSDKPPQGAASNEEQWSTASESSSDSGKAESSAGSVSQLKTPPSYMPEPPKPEIMDSRDRYKNSPGADSTEYRDASRYNYSDTSAKAGRTYTVAEGDSLFDIARCELGKASRWVEIYDLNIGVLGKDIDCLVPGTQIVLPDDNAQTTRPFTRQSQMEYRK